MARYKCRAHISKPKTGGQVTVRFRAVPGGYKSADDCICKDEKSALELVQRNAKRWGHEVDVVREGEPGA